MKALVFAAGHGTRLKPLTDSIPKALVKVGSKPVLQRVIEKLESAGYDDIVVNVHHFPDQIVSFLRTYRPATSVSFEDGAEPLETGGGIKHAAALLHSQQGRFLVHNTDILSDLDLRSLNDRIMDDSLATLVVEDKPADRVLLFDEDMNLCGWTNTKTGEVKSPFEGFNPSGYRAFSFCGIHVISEDVFPMMERWPDRFGIVDFYLSVCRERKIRGIPVQGLHLIDIGTPENLRRANELECSDAPGSD